MNCFFKNKNFFCSSILSLATFLFHICSAQAQDTIVKRNNEIIVAKILEVSKNEIKYKHANYQEGPVFIISKWELKYVAYGNGSKESCEGFIEPSINNSQLFLKRDLTIQSTGSRYYYQNQKITEQDMLDVAKRLQYKKINTIIKRTEELKITKNCLITGGILCGTLGLLTYAGVLSSFNKSSVPATAVKGRGASRTAQRAARIKQQRYGAELLLGGISLELLSLGFNLKERQHAHVIVDCYNNLISK